MAGIKDTLQTYVYDPALPSDNATAKDRLGDALINADDIGQTGPNTISKIAIGSLGGVQAAWDFEGDLTDRSGNGLDMSGTVVYATIDGKQCAYHRESDAWDRSSHDSELAITGALTVHCLIRLTRPPTGDDRYLFAFMSGGESSADNYLYSLRYDGAGNNPTMYYLHERGSGVNDEHNFDIPLPEGSWHLVTLTRDSAGTSVNLYFDGNLAGDSPGSLSAAPDGGGSSKFRLFSSDFQGINAFFGDVVVQNVEMSAGDILAVAQQVGVTA